MENLDPKILMWISSGVVLLVGILYAAFMQLDRVKIKKFIDKHTPDQIEFLMNMLWDAAWKAVDAQVDKYKHLTDDEKQALAMKYVKLLLKFLATGKLEPEANAAFLEYRLIENQAEHRALKKKAA
jgi:hypothetical protein